MQHILAHSGRYVYRHEDLIAIAGECGGQILALFEYWTACRQAEIQRVQTINSQIKGKGRRYAMPDKWLKETLEDIRLGLLGGWGETSIKKTMRELVDKNFLIQSKHRNPWLRTRCYQLNIPVVQQALNEWKAQQEGITVDLSIQHETAETLATPDQLLLTDREGENNLIDKTISPLDYIYNNPIEHSHELPSCVSENAGKREEEDKPNLSLALNDDLLNEIKSSGGATPPQGQKCADIMAWIDRVISDPKLESTDPIPSVMKAELKARGWVFPWRTKLDPQQPEFGTCDRRLVEHLTKTWVNYAGSYTTNWRDRIPDAIKHIGDNELTKGGLEKLMGYWFTINKPAKPEKLKPEKPARGRSPFEPPQEIKEEWTKIASSRKSIFTESERLEAKAKEPVIDPEELKENDWIESTTGRLMTFTGVEILEKINNHWALVWTKPKPKIEKPFMKLAFQHIDNKKQRMDLEMKYSFASREQAKNLGRSLSKEEEMTLREAILTKHDLPIPPM